jgi:HK97 family phage portal protein
MNLFKRKPSKAQLMQKINALEQRASQTAKLLVPFTGMGGAIWTDRNYESFSREAYLKNVITYRCIKEISRAFSSVEWDLFTKNSEGKRVRVEEENPMKKILKRPNPEDSFSFLLTAAASYGPLAGNIYFEKIAPITGPNKNVPKELYVLRPDRMKVLVDKQSGMKKGYEYEIHGRKTKWEVNPITGDSPILHMKTFNPLNDWYGLSDVEPTAREIDTSNSATDYKKNMIDNEGRPGMIVGVEEGIGDQELDAVEKSLKKLKEGPRNAGKTFIVEGVKNVSPYAFKPKEMDFLKSDIELMRRIAIGFSVPPMIIGIPGEATFANFAEAVLYFWDTTVLFWLQFFKGELNNWFFGFDDNKLFYDFILDNVPALAPKREKTWKRAQESDFLTINEKREMVGKEKVEAGDVILVDSSKLPLEQAGLEQEDETDEESVKKLQDLGYSKEQINEMIGLPKDGQIADKSCDHKPDNGRVVIQ